MTVLVVGASGATGRLLVADLLRRGERVTAIVRSSGRLPDCLRDEASLSVVQAPILELGHDELTEQVSGCRAVASCLGHNLTFRGMYGSPRMLVTDATRRLCEAIRASRPQGRVRFVLMNTAGNSNRGVNEPLSLGERFAIGLIRLLVPPHRDNEQAAAYLRSSSGENDDVIEWAVVRPDTLVDEDHTTDYEVHPSPTRSALFNAGKTSRVNVAHFMAELITRDDMWRTWKGRMPVIYNKT